MPLGVGLQRRDLAEPIEQPPMLSGEEPLQRDPAEPIEQPLMLLVADTQPVVRPQTNNTTTAPF